MFCNMNEMFSYYKYFIKDSIHLNNNKLYIYYHFTKILSTGFRKKLQKVTFSLDKCRLSW